MANSPKLPHTLRILILLLRITLGLSFFYLGFTVLFQPLLMKYLGAQPLAGLYPWLNSTSLGSLQPLFVWIFLIVGACLILGLFARFAAIGGIALVATDYLPGVLSKFNAYQLISNQVLIVICLLIIVCANAGTYFGFDKFIHIHLASKHKE